MKMFHIAALVIISAFSANVFAQPAVPAKGIKITKITGTVNIMKDGAVIMTLKPGDAIPEMTGNDVTFSIVDGTVEVEAGGKKISAATGSNFTVTASEGQVNVSLGAGTPVAVKSESGHNVILTANSEVKMVNTNGTVQISMEKGNAVVTNASGGETQTIQAGQSVSVPSAYIVTPTAPAAPAPVEEIVTTEDALPIVPVVEPPPPSVIPTTEVTEGEEVSGSTP